MSERDGSGGGFIQIPESIERDGSVSVFFQERENNGELDAR